jgi:hypothetical protein
VDPLAALVIQVALNMNEAYVEIARQARETTKEMRKLGLGILRSQLDQILEDTKENTKAERHAQWQPCPVDATHGAEWYPWNQYFPDGWFVRCRRCNREVYRRATFQILEETK